MTLGEIFRTHGPSYRQTHPLVPVQHQAMRAIETCRTAAQGGHQQTCDRCGAVRLRYNSCRNRHCPQCQTLSQWRWREARRATLLPVPYFHVVFTLPHELNSLAQANPRVIYDSLFAAAAESLLQFGRDPRHLGGTLGLTAVLHTWGRNLSQHIHLHAIVTGGALAPDGSRWIASRHRNFLFPVRALSTVFRAHFLQRLADAFARGQCRFAGGTAALADPSAFSTWCLTLRRHPWVVYCKAPVAGPEQVLDYLARYTRRVAISNERLVGFSQDHVRFRWKDHAHGGVVKILELPAVEFIRRFLLHVLPAGFVRIRHFGLLANRDREPRLARCRDVLHPEPPPRPAAPESAAALMLRLTGIDPEVCPFCLQGRLRVTAILSARSPVRLESSVPDTS